MVSLVPPCFRPTTRKTARFASDPRCRCRHREAHTSDSSEFHLLWLQRTPAGCARRVSAIAHPSDLLIVRQRRNSVVYCVEFFPAHCTTKLFKAGSSEQPAACLPNTSRLLRHPKTSICSPFVLNLVRAPVLEKNRPDYARFMRRIALRPTMPIGLRTAS